MPFVTTRIDLEGNILNEIRSRKIKTLYDLSYMCNLTKQTKRQAQKTNWCLLEKGGRWEKWVKASKV